MDRHYALKPFAEAQAQNADKLPKSRVAPSENLLERARCLKIDPLDAVLTWQTDSACQPCVSFDVYIVKLRSARSASTAMRFWFVVGYTVGGRRLTGLGCPKVRTGCHFGDHTLLGDESTIKCVRKDERENQGQEIGIHA